LEAAQHWARRSVPAETGNAEEGSLFVRKKDGGALTRDSITSDVYLKSINVGKKRPLAVGGRGGATGNHSGKSIEKFSSY